MAAWFCCLCFHDWLQMMNSGRLQAHFEDNPKDLVVLRHDSALQPHKVKRHLASVPSYLLPSTLQAAATAAGGGVQSSNNKKRRRQMNSDAPVSAPTKDVDPLKTFEYNARKKAQTGEADGPSVVLVCSHPSVVKEGRVGVCEAFGHACHMVLPATVCLQMRFCLCVWVCFRLL